MASAAASKTPRASKRFPPHTPSLQTPQHMFDKQSKALSELASRQHGLVTHTQALSVGLNRMALSRLMRSGTWEQVRPRVFRKAAKSQTEEQALFAVCLWMGSSAVVSHRSAARILGLDLKKGELEVTTLPRFNAIAKGVVVHRSKILTERDRRTIRGIPVTTGARTIIDLAGEFDADELAILVEEAWRRKIAAPDWVAQRLKELGKQARRTGALAEILADCRSRNLPMESALEVRLWRLLKRHGLKPIPHSEFRDDFGQPGHVDFAFPDRGLAIECDGYETHGTREAFENDRLRAARLVSSGWRVMMLTWKQVTEEPKKVIALIQQALKFGRATAL